jgi:hypothetical protein
MQRTNDTHVLNPGGFGRDIVKSLDTGLCGGGDNNAPAMPVREIAPDGAASASSPVTQEVFLPLAQDLGQ